VIFREPDGSPNRGSDLTDETLKKAVSMAGNYDITFAYDGDSDRLALIDSKGRLAEAETIAYMILKELLKREQGPVVANVECSNIIDRIADQYNRTVNRVRVGNTFMMQTIYDNNACFGVETSGHFVIPSIFPFDDAIAVSLFAAYALSRVGKDFSEIVDGMPGFTRYRVNLECPDNKKFKVVEGIRKRLSGEYESINTMDGVRVDFDKAWVLIRPSNTSPLIRLTIEAENKDEFEKLKGKFSEIVKEGIRAK
jgi:phosphomannomutase